MSMRITTNSVLRNYKSNLAKSMSNLDTIRTQVMTGDRFSSVSEDPAGALRAATLEREYARNNDYLSLVEEAQSFQNTQEDAAMQIYNIAITLSKDYGLEALNSTNQSADVRQTYADAWEGSLESIVMCLNTTYDEKYVFAGGDGGEAPFQLEDGVLTYRGVDVNSTDPADQAILDELSDESVYLDLGFGLEYNEDGSIVASSAFDTSLPGINLVGYGQDENGNSKNMVVLAAQIADLLKEEDFDYDKYQELLTAFEDASSTVLSSITTMGTRTEFLTTTAERLENTKISITEQYDNIAHVDMAEAITDYSYAQYVYEAALKVGTSILSPSFIDYMS